jgi:hypothetical protein
MVLTEELCDCRKCEPQIILRNFESASAAGFQSPSPAAADFIRGRCDVGVDTVKVDFKTEYEVKDSKRGLVAGSILLYSIYNTIKIPKGFCDIISYADHISGTCLPRIWQQILSLHMCREELLTIYKIIINNLPLTSQYKQNDITSEKQITSRYVQGIYA